MRTVAALILIALLAAACSSPGRAPDAAESAEVTAARREMAGLDQAIQMYFLTHGRLPGRLRDLTYPTGEGEPPLLLEVPADPWGEGYLYEVRSDGRPVYRLTSAGPDRSFGSADDLQIGAIR